MRVVQALSKYATVLTEHIGDPNLTNQGEGTMPDEGIYDRDMTWLMEADALVAEVTSPSLGVGYEIGKAESVGKPILCLYHEIPGKKISGMLLGNKNITVKSYGSFEEIDSILQAFLLPFS